MADTCPTVAAYGIEKSYLERAVDAFEARHGETIRVVRVRSAFVFQPPAAPEQLRIFGGRLAPARLIGSRRLPVLPLPAGLRFQNVHAEDLAAAYLATLLRPVCGPFNVAADPVIDARSLSSVLRARAVEVPPRLVRMSLAVAFHARLSPVEPGLLELFMTLPVMNTNRARRELGWAPRHSAVDALDYLVAGLAERQGAPTPAPRRALMSPMAQRRLAARHATETRLGSIFGALAQYRLGTRLLRLAAASRGHPDTQERRLRPRHRCPPTRGSLVVIGRARGGPTSWRNARLGSLVGNEVADLCSSGLEPSPASIAAWSLSSTAAARSLDRAEDHPGEDLRAPPRQRH